MLRRALVALTVVGVLFAAVGVVVLGPGADTPSGGAELGLAQSGEFNTTVFRIQVFENGDARWTIEYSRILETEDDISQFESFADQFVSEETEAFVNFQIRADKLTQSGTEATGRQMNATEFQRDAYVDQLGQTRGVIQMSFLWTAFARQDGDTVVVADVFDGGWGIVEDQRLTIQRGESLVFDTVSPDPDSMTNVDNLTASESVTWFGQRQFTDERPRVVLVPAAQLGSGTGTPTATPTDTSPSDEPTETGTPPAQETGTDRAGATVTETDTAGADDQPDSGSNSDMMPVVAIAVLVLGVGGGIAWYSGAFRENGDTTAQSPETEPLGAEQSGVAAESAPAVSEEELLSDEDRVLQLLERNGGRMKQVDIVDETEWSKSKVSMLLSEMEQDGQISKLRVGRENIISLSGEEPEAASSPYDSE